MGLCSSLTRPDYNWQPDFIAAVQDNFHGVLAAMGVYTDVRGIIIGYWLPTTDLAVIKRNLDGWKHEASGRFYRDCIGQLTSTLHDDVKDLDFSRGGLWSETFTPFLVRLDLPFISPTDIRPVTFTDKKFGGYTIDHKEYTPVAGYDTLKIYQKVSNEFYTWFTTDGDRVEDNSEDRLRKLIAIFAFEKDERETCHFLMANLTHKGVSPIDFPYEGMLGCELKLFQPLTRMYSLLLAAPTMTAASWNAWFNLFLDVVYDPYKHKVACGYANVQENCLRNAFLMLHLDLKCPLNELTPMKSFENCREEIKGWCRYLHSQMYNLGFESFEHFEKAVKALQARVDVANSTLSIGSRKRKAED